MTKKEKNGWELHGITHSSASSVNNWINAPCNYIAKKLLGKYPEGSPAMHRGIVVESAVANVIYYDWSFELASKQAFQQYYRKCVTWPDKDEVEKQAEVILPMIELALEYLLDLGKPAFAEDGQIKTELLCNGDGWQLPVIGYLDFYYPDLNLIVDLKTTLRMPTKDKELDDDHPAPHILSPEHNRQAVIYYQSFDRKYEVEFLYVTPKKYGIGKPHDVDETLAEIKAVLNRQERLLRAFPDANELAKVIPVNLSSYYWSGEPSEKVRKEVFGI